MSAEGVPVAWAVVDRHGVLLPNSNEAAEVACFRTKDEADEELAYANQGEGAPPWEDSKPFAVVALAPTHPAAASAEREALLDTVDALLDAVRKFVKKDTPTGLMRLNDAMVAAREAVAAARATKEV